MNIPGDNKPFIAAGSSSASDGWACASRSDDDEMANCVILQQHHCAFSGVPFPTVGYEIGEENNNL